MTRSPSRRLLAGLASPLDRLRSICTAQRLVVAALVWATALGVVVVVGRRAATVQVWTLAAEVPAGSPVDEGDLVAVDLPAHSPLVAGLWVADGPAPTGVAARMLVPGRPLLADDLDAANPVARTLAVAVPVEVVVALGVREGERIDLIDADGDAGATVVVASVRVAAVETSEGPVRSDAMVVIEVDEVTALRVAAAAADGELTVVRSTGAAGEATS